MLAITTRGLILLARANQDANDIQSKERIMAKWRDAFESSLPPPERRQYQEEYVFGPPATHEQLKLAEQELGRTLPQEVREMLLEFNGVWCKTKFGGEPEIVLLDTNHIAHEVPHHLRTCGNQQPPDEELAKVVFVYQQNGFADLYGVCAEDFGDFRAGHVVFMDHEVGELEEAYPNLLELLRNVEAQTA